MPPPNQQSFSIHHPQSETEMSMLQGLRNAEEYKLNITISPGINQVRLWIWIQVCQPSFFTSYSKIVAKVSWQSKSEPSLWTKWHIQTWALKLTVLWTLLPTCHCSIYPPCVRCLDLDIKWCMGKRSWWFSKKQHTKTLCLASRLYPVLLGLAILEIPHGTSTEKTSGHLLTFCLT